MQLTPRYTNNTLINTIHVIICVNNTRIYALIKMNCIYTIKLWFRWTISTERNNFGTAHAQSLSISSTFTNKNDTWGSTDEFHCWNALFEHANTNLSPLFQLQIKHTHKIRIVISKRVIEFIITKKDTRAYIAPVTTNIHWLHCDKTTPNRGI